MLYSVKGNRQGGSSNSVNLGSLDNFFFITVLRWQRSSAELMQNQETFIIKLGQHGLMSMYHRLKQFNRTEIMKISYAY